ncbi:unannotated protein [freshwater metagenome]|uniref:Unannotated protein n=1 Tax=freshwater metagenome TaxID=449393 RepID=A0A6J7VSM3_9ZZZZ
MISIEACSKIAGPSITTDPMAAEVDSSFRILHTWASDKTRVPTVMLNCTVGRSAFETNASTSTPINAPDRRIKIGERSV